MSVWVATDGRRRGRVAGALPPRLRMMLSTFMAFRGGRKNFVRGPFFDVFGGVLVGFVRCDNGRELDQGRFRLRNNLLEGHGQVQLDIVERDVDQRIRTR